MARVFDNTRNTFSLTCTFSDFQLNTFAFAGSLIQTEKTIEIRAYPHCVARVAVHTQNCAGHCSRLAVGRVMAFQREIAVQQIDTIVVGANPDVVAIASDRHHAARTNGVCYRRTAADEHKLVVGRRLKHNALLETTEPKAMTVVAHY